MQIELSGSLVEKENLVGKMREMEKVSVESNADLGQNEVSLPISIRLFR